MHHHGRTIHFAPEQLTPHQFITDGINARLFKSS